MEYPLWYKTASRRYRRPETARLINQVDRALVYIVAIAYFVMLFVVYITGNDHFWRALIVPAITFAIVTAIRELADKPRPYELYDIHPIIEKDTRGKSLPSRHMASAIIIACAFTWVSVPLGVIGFVMCAVIAFTRIIGGVHFPRDIVAAALISGICGLLGFVIVP